SISRLRSEPAGETGCGPSSPFKLLPGSGNLSTAAPHAMMRLDALRRPRFTSYSLRRPEDTALRPSSPAAPWPRLPLESVPEDEAPPERGERRTRAGRHGFGREIALEEERTVLGSVQARPREVAQAAKRAHRPPEAHAVQVHEVEPEGCSLRG